jgi:hypothetical protein
MQPQPTSTLQSAQSHSSRRVDFGFDGGFVSSDGGALLLREVLGQSGLADSIAGCFVDTRNQDFVEFSVPQLISQRIVGLIQGYEDLNDHDYLRVDPVLALAVGRTDILGHDRRLPEDVGKPLAGKSTLNRLELSADPARKSSRYHKIAVNMAQLEALLLQTFIREHHSAPEELWLDLDTTDFALHGEQEGRHFSAYYDHYCYTPLYIMCGDFPLLSRLRSASVAPSKDVVEHLRPVVARLRQAWPNVRIVVRADSGFCCDDLLTYCEEVGISFLVGLATNDRLKAIVASDMALVKADAKPDQSAPPRAFSSFQYQTLHSWTRDREVIARLEWAGDKPNARFVVTNLPMHAETAERLYEQGYCQRALMENHLKEQQLDLFASRMSTHVKTANQLRLMFSTFASVVIRLLRRTALKGTAFETATTNTIRVRLLKIGTILKITTRRIVLSFASAFPNAAVFNQAMAAFSRTT